MLFTLFTWWLTLLLVGLACWPILLRLGWASEAALWAWARPAGLVLWAWAAWLLGHVLPVGLALGLTLGALALLGVAAGVSQRQRLRATLVTNWRALLVGELLFVALAAGVLWTRGWAPGIAHTEQPMDMAFLASCIRATRLPPTDPWLAGEPLSYYYLGYLLWGLVARLTGTAPTVAYNLALAATAGLAAQALYGLLHRHLAVSGYWRRALAGAAGAALILAAGNLAMLAESLRAVGALPANLARWLGVPGLAEAPITGSLLPDGSWWWRVTRLWLDPVLPGRNAEMIIEFPAFSLALGDLHPHLLALPFSVAVVGLALTNDGGRLCWPRALVLGLLIGGVGFINGWELPLLLALAALWQLLAARAGGSARRAVAAIALVCAGAALPYLPFWATLDSQVTGLRVAWLARTQLRGFVLALGVWALPVWFWLWDGRRVRRFWRWWAALLLAPVGLVLLVGGPGSLGLALLGAPRGLALALLLSGALALIAARLWQRPAASEAAPLLLLFGGFGLAYVGESVYLGDLFGTRMNTLFKLYYQAWWLLATVALVVMATWLAQRNWRRGVAWAMLSLWAALATYPLLTAPTPTSTWSLDALTPLAAIAPDEAAAVTWLQTHAGPTDVLLAAPGGSYQVAAVRLSALSGVPQVLGWPEHERQWGRSAAQLARRERDVATAYTAADVTERDAVLRRYGVTLVVLGPRERALYGGETIALWPPRCTAALASGGLTLLRCIP